MEDRHPPRSGSITGGLVLIGLGIIFMLQQFGKFSLHNWWALFILLPALGSFGTTFTLLRRGRGFTYAARSSLFGGLLLTWLSAMFLFELDWAKFWPMFILIPGLSVLFSGLQLGSADEPGGTMARRLYQPWLTWIGASASLLGLTFLVKNLGYFDPSTILKNWWGIFILLPAIGGLFATYRLWLESRALNDRGRFNMAVIGNLVATLTVALVGVVAILGLNWNLIGPLLMIGIGLALMLGFLGSQRAP